jgi:hypothetical protein
MAIDCFGGMVGITVGLGVVLTPIGGDGGDDAADGGGGTVGITVGLAVVLTPTGPTRGDDSGVGDTVPASSAEVGEAATDEKGIELVGGIGTGPSAYVVKAKLTTLKTTVPTIAARSETLCPPNR